MSGIKQNAARCYNRFTTQVLHILAFSLLQHKLYDSGKVVHSLISRIRCVGSWKNTQTCSTRCTPGPGLRNCSKRIINSWMMRCSVTQPDADHVPVRRLEHGSVLFLLYHSMLTFQLLKKKEKKKEVILFLIILFNHL